MEWGAVGVVDFTGVGGASAVAKVVSKFPKKDVGGTYCAMVAGTSASTRSQPMHIH